MTRIRLLCVGDSEGTASSNSSPSESFSKFTESSVVLITCPVRMFDTHVATLLRPFASKLLQILSHLRIDLSPPVLMVSEASVHQVEQFHLIPRLEETKTLYPKRHLFQTVSKASGRTILSDRHQLKPPIRSQIPTSNRKT